jgi:hypothetical protein
MAVGDKRIADVPVTWTWTGDPYAITGFNIAVVATGGDPDTDAIVRTHLPVSFSITDALDDGSLSFSHTFTSVTLVVGTNIGRYVQAVYIGSVGPWTSTLGSTVDDTTGIVDSTVEKIGTKAVAAGGVLVYVAGSWAIGVGVYLSTLTNNPPTATDCTSDGQLHVYTWTGSAWETVATVGDTTARDAAHEFLGQGSGSVYIDENNVSGSWPALEVIKTGNGPAINSTNDTVGVIDAECTGTGGTNAEYGIWAKGSYGMLAVHRAEGVGGPLNLLPSSSASAPSHSADKGTLWVTSSGVLYINTSGSTTWGKVGAQ